jgi:hypothetical protein
MIYLYLYLSIGAVLLAIVFGTNLLTKKDAVDSLRDILNAEDPDRKKLSYRILNNYLLPVLAAIVFMIVWPGAFYMKVKEDFSKKGNRILNQKRKFAVEHAHLKERMTIQQIEAREVIEDPLGAVPNLPFGHLNAAWKTFIEAVAADDELWSFTAHWETMWGRKDVRTGYVVVRGGVPASHFLIMLKQIEDEPK